jgi:hypothetical protein
VPVTEYANWAGEQQPHASWLEDLSSFFGFCRQDSHRLVYWLAKDSRHDPH